MTLTASKMLALVALICAVLAVVAPSYPLLHLAIILLAVAEFL